MSRKYDAKNSVLKAYPNDKESGVSLFYEILDCGESDFEYEEGMTAEEYIYGELSDNEVKITDDFGNDWYFQTPSQPKTE